jgi:radical SAM superfamily enzyme YgiQ (UPF0313 family)
MKRLLLLINPVDTGSDDAEQKHLRRNVPLGLGIVASLTPGHWDVEIIDGYFDEFNFKPADLVGITAYTNNVNDAYKFAGLYRRHQVHTVLGGIHATILPEEAANFADTVVVGEAENVWPDLIADFENGSIKKQYKADFHSLQNLVVPRRELFADYYTQASMQTSRGCPLHCEFCTIPTFSGNKTRYRPVEEVLDEIESLKQDLLFFVDDNLFGMGKENIERSIALFGGMVKRGIHKKWVTFGGVNCADNDTVLKLAAQSGCRMIYIGFETEDLNALKTSGKEVNIKHVKDNYKHIIRKLHKHGILVQAGLMFGFDTDDEINLNKRIEFARKASIDIFHISTLTPYPGTHIYNRLKQENRLIFDNSIENWDKYNFKDLVFFPKLVSKEYFELFMKQAHNKLYNKRFLKLRYLRTLVATRSFEAAKIAYHANLGTAGSFSNYF